MRKSLVEAKISPTNVIKSKIKQLESDGHKIIRLDTIETDLKTPKNIKDAAIKAIQDDRTKYTIYSGTTELKDAVCKMLKNKYKLTYKTNDCLISCGSKHALFNTVFTLLNNGDEAIIFAPYWETYLEQVSISDGKPVIVETEERNNFEPTEEQILKAVTSKTRIIIINSPSNPTGRVYSRSTFLMISKIAREKNLFVVSDETMANFTYGSIKHTPIASLSRDIFERTFTIGSTSKDYSMSGFRIGFVCGPTRVIDRMSVLQAQVTANPVSFAQVAAIEAWSGEQGGLEKTINEFAERKQTLENGLSKIKGMKNIVGQGAVFLFPNIASFLGRKIAGRLIENSEEFCDLLLEHGVAVVPGNYFGDKYNKNIRVSFSSANKKEIREAIQIFQKLL